MKKCGSGVPAAYPSSISGTPSRLRGCDSARRMREPMRHPKRLARFLPPFVPSAPTQSGEDAASTMFLLATFTAEISVPWDFAYPNPA